MRAVVQRVSYAEVRVEGEPVGAIEKGLLILVAIAPHDTPSHVEKLAHKLLNLRIFEDAKGKMNLSLSQIGGGMLIISQFTLYADVWQGHRPYFGGAAPPDQARALYEALISWLRQKTDLPIETGVFGAYMEVKCVNYGPVTLIIDV
ncbi:MAG: D-aminoacyl-tRNA deacylase [Bacteroidia bacterium]